MHTEGRGAAAEAAGCEEPDDPLQESGEGEGTLREDEDVRTHREPNPIPRPLSCKHSRTGSEYVAKTVRTWCNITRLSRCSSVCVGVCRVMEEEDERMQQTATELKLKREKSEGILREREQAVQKVHIMHTF